MKKYTDGKVIVKATPMTYSEYLRDYGCDETSYPEDIVGMFVILLSTDDRLIYAFCPSQAGFFEKFKEVE